MQPRQISFDSIRPFVRSAKEVPISDLKGPGAVFSYDHRLMYAVSGSGILEINGSLREIHPGMVLYRMSGTPYSLRARHGNTLDVIAVNFDFTHGKSSIVRFLPLALPCLQSIMAEQATPDSFSDLQPSQLLGAVLNLIRRHASRRQSGRERHGPLQQLLEYIQAHYGEALFLLQSTDLPIREIAVRVGFKNSSCFSRYFKKVTGYTPCSFRIDQPGIKRPAVPRLIDVRG